MSERVLLLNNWFLPTRVIPWQDAIKMVYEKTVDVVAEYSETVSSPSVTWNMPAVIRLRRQPSVRRKIKFSRMNVYQRDDFRCQYCGKRHAWDKLSYDHIVPRARGGRTTYTNIVSACKPCNSRKGRKSCDEAGMWPLREPQVPRHLPSPRPRIDVELAPEEWLPYLTA